MSTCNSSNCARLKCFCSDIVYCPQDVVLTLVFVGHRELLQTVSTADFYSTMARLGERLRKAQLLPSTEFMQVLKAIEVLTE